MIIPSCHAGRDVRVRTLVAAALTAFMTVAAATSHAADPVADRRGTFSINLDNDLFADTDRYYTNGLQLAWSAPEGPVPTWIDRAAELSGPLLPAEGRSRWGLALGQEIYTPNDITLANPDRTDRPYAGWLYGAVSYSTYTDTSLAALELQLGVVGPSALGEQAQNTVHEFNGGVLAEGWDFQLDDEPGVNVVLTRLWRFTAPLDPARPRGWAVGAVPSLQASLGNVRTHASGGFMVRAGRDLKVDFGPPRIRPSIGGTNFVQPDGRWGWYVFAGVEGRAVARDIFLDGNSFKSSRSVDKKPLVGEASLGSALVFPWGRLAYTQTFRSEEFEGQETASEFGSISLSLRF